MTAATAPAGAPAQLPDWVPQALQQQLAGRLVAMASSGAVQRLTVQLHPADLGAVQVIATMDNGTVNLQLLAGNHATREAMRAALPMLQADLTSAGLGGTQLDVSDQAPGQQSFGSGATGHGGDPHGSAGPGAPRGSGRTDEAAASSVLGRTHSSSTRPTVTVDGRRAIDVQI